MDMNVRHVLRTLLKSIRDCEPITAEKAATLLDILDHGRHYALGSPNPIKEDSYEEFTEERLMTSEDLERMQIPEDRAPEPGKTTRHYTSFSGVDTTPFIVKEGKITPIGVIQGLSMSVDRAGFVKGNIISLVLDRSIVGTLGSHVPGIILQACTEFGDSAWSAIIDVDIVHHSTGISIDDITMDDNLEYEAKHYLPWRPGRLVRVGVKGDDRENPTKKSGPSEYFLLGEDGKEIQDIHQLLS